MAARIRPFRPGDRAAIRRIAVDTADTGSPGGWLFPFPEVTADLLTRYYTDFEPEMCLVAEQEGDIIGYASGTVRPPRHRLIMRTRVIPLAVLRAIARGALWQRRSWQWAQAVFLTWIRCARPDPLPEDVYPGHLHINVRPRARGHEVGTELASQLMDRMAAAGCPGVHARVHGDNQAARRFFTQLGFRPLLRYAWIMPTPSGCRAGFTVIYARRL